VNDDQEIVQAFLEESAENLDQLERDLVDLEGRPGDRELLDRVYRAIHTIKGTCGFLGFHKLEALTHVGENLLDELRSGRLVLDASITTSMLGLVDAIRTMLVGIDATGQEVEDDHAGVMAAMAGHLAPTSAGPSGLTHVAGAELASSSPVRSMAESSIRVDITLLDKLMLLVGELVLARSQLGELVDAQDEGPLVLPYRQLRLVTTQLQEAVMRARLQPVGMVIGRFPRVARDLAASMGKRVRVELVGEEVGVDKAINAALKDPLLHLVRNAIDHGIETPAERIAAGKDPEGRLRIRAFHDCGRVVIELSDDGQGVDLQRLAAAAVAAGVVTSDVADALDTREVIELMFRPGLTTKDGITSVSGRGVGMDVVRANLDLVGGSIEVSSVAGQGSSFRMNVPLTLAVMPVVMVRCGGDRYAVPQIQVSEVVHVEPADLATSLDEVKGVRLLRRHGWLLPLIELAQRLGVTPVDVASGGLNVVVVEADGKRFGVVVDEVGDALDALIKPLTRAIRSIPLFAGVTILGDGRPSLVLDLSGLAVAAGVTVISQEPTADAGGSDATSSESNLLLATGAGGGRLAVLLAAVRRLEQFPGGRVQRSGTMDVVEYGDTILPLLQVTKHLPEHPARGEYSPMAGMDELQTIVCETSIGLVGVVVERIGDVAFEPRVLAQPLPRRGVGRRVVINDQVTELLDIEALVADAALTRVP
jgi:two-component system, chemotaxis family, sensor kinase CheA